MSNQITEAFTAPQLNYRILFELRTELARNIDARKELEVFLDHYQSSKAVIPEKEHDLRQAIAEFLLGNYEVAERTLQSDSSQGSLLYKTLIAYLQDRRTTALKLLDELKTQALNSSDPDFVVSAALAACDLRCKAEAEELFAKVDEAQAGDYYVYLKAYLSDLNYQHQEALDLFEGLAKQNGALQGLALFHHARLLDMWGYDDEALKVYTQIETLGYAFEEALINAGVLHEDRGEYSQALRCYLNALKINPNNKRAKLYHSDAEACLDMQYDERKLKQDIKTSEILAIPISDFELSVRSRNCLSKMGIFTLRDLITKTEQELLSYKNFGETSLKEIRNMLAKKGLHLGMTRVDEQPLAERIKLNTQLFNQNKDYALDQLDITIEDLNLSYRTKSALHKMGFESLRDITMRTGRDLEANPNFSPACLQEVNALLEERGLSYRPETSTSKPDYDNSGPAGSGAALLGEEAPQEELVAEVPAAPSSEDEHYDDE